MQPLLTLILSFILFACSSGSKTKVDSNDERFSDVNEDNAAKDSSSNPENPSPGTSGGDGSSSGDNDSEDSTSPSQIEFTWEKPTEKNISIYKLYVENLGQSFLMADNIEVADPDQPSHLIDLSDFQAYASQITGDFCFTLVAVNDQGKESDPSDAACLSADSL